MTATPSRLLALEVVTRVRERQAFAHETLGAALTDSGLAGRDAAFATVLAYGTISWRGTLDEVVDRYVSRPESLDPAVRDALALSAYELLRCSTPPRAAVSQGVELVRSRAPRAAGLANAVLRRLSEDAAAFPWGDPETDPATFARGLGHPRWLADLWTSELGRKAAETVMAADDAPAPLYLAWVEGSGLSYEESLDLLAQDGAQPRQVFLPGCVVADDPAAAVRGEALRRGAFIVMDAAAQFAVAVAAASDGDRVVEIGAGRGGKSLLWATLARRVAPLSSLAAVDVHEYKLAGLAKSAADRGLTEVATVALDASSPAALAGEPRLAPCSSDVVLVDAPCSGLGTLRRHPDRRWKSRPDEIVALAALGASLLRSAASLVGSGGFVVYSTCTLARAENEDVVLAFLSSEEGRSFVSESLGELVPPEWSAFVTPEGWFRSLPAAGGPDGHFVARLRRL